METDGLWPASYRRETASIPGASRLDLWFTKWHRETAFSEYFSFPLPVSFHHCAVLILHLL